MDVVVDPVVEILEPIETPAEDLLYLYGYSLVGFGFCSSSEGLFLASSGAV